MQIIEPAAWRAQPWRNGAGVTHELVRWPEREPFEIRISVADISEPAPFSTFAGYRRWLYLLEGGPVSLTHDYGPAILTEPGDGLAFAGDEQVAAVSVARPSRDLNFMVRAELPSRAVLFRGGAREELDGAAACVFVIEGELDVAAARGAGEVAERRTLGRHGCAFCTGARVTLELAGDALAAVLLIER